jgi:ribonuclease HI
VSVFIGPHWVVFFDGSACSQGCGAGVVLMSPNGEQLRYVVCLNLKATNNMA